MVDFPWNRPIRRRIVFFLTAIAFIYFIVNAVTNWNQGFQWQVYQAKAKCTVHLLLSIYTLVYTFPEKQSVQCTLCWNSLHFDFFDLWTLKAAYVFKLIKDYIFLFTRNQNVFSFERKNNTKYNFLFWDVKIWLSYTLYTLYTLLKKTKWNIHFADKK